MILLDTHVVLWLLSDQALLSQSVADALRSERHQGAGIAISDITLWELAMLKAKNKIEYPHPVQHLLERVESNFVILPINRLIAEKSQMFSPRYPKDPVDRILGATAIVHGLPFVTKDRPIRASGEVDCLW